MFPFWEVAVAPVLEAAGVRRLVEIGALRGENTRQIIERLGPQTELHVIDPLPDFDPAAHEREFAGQYVFHRDLSLNVLGDLPPVDAALIDGDHNWYTVYNELRLLREVARRHGERLPLLVLHDVGWPYGRRDLYYDPSNIPDEFRHDWRRAGLKPGKSRLVPSGLNPTLAHAEVEGGARNGVRTALDDFVAEHDRPMRVVVLPIYFGLAIAAEVERLEAQPALSAELDRLESASGKDQLLDLAEDVRIDALIFQHQIFFARERSLTRLAQRYLDQVKDGPVGAEAGRGWLDRLERCLDTIREEYVLGDLVAVGAERPGAALFLAAYRSAHDLDRRLVAIGGGQDGGFHAGLERLRLVDERTVEIDGSDAVDVDLPDQVSMLHVGPGAPVGVLDRLYERLAHGAYVVLDDAAETEVAERVAKLCAGDSTVELGPGHGGWRRRDAGMEVVSDLTQEA